MTSQQSSCLNMWINHLCKDGKLDLGSVIWLLKEDGFNTTQSPTRYRFDPQEVDKMQFMTSHYIYAEGTRGEAQHLRDNMTFGEKEVLAAMTAHCTHMTRAERKLAGFLAYGPSYTCSMRVCPVSTE